MSRDKIEEMAHDMCEYYYEGTCYQDKNPCDCKCDIFTDAEYLYGKGYRKASEVALEVIGYIETLANKQIDVLNVIEPIDPRMFHGGKHAFEIVLKTIAELKKKYESEDTE